MWIYATVGMSGTYSGHLIELHLFSPTQQIESHVELLTVVAHYHLTRARLGLHHTVNFGRPWLPDSDCQHGLISLPYLDGEKMEIMNLKEKHIHCLWLIPITKKEIDFVLEKGLEALETAFESSKFNYLDPYRPSVV
jgi:hypothetical protein